MFFSPSSRVTLLFCFFIIIKSVLYPTITFHLFQHTNFSLTNIVYFNVTPSILWYPQSNKHWWILLPVTSPLSLFCRTISKTWNIFSIRLVKIYIPQIHILLLRINQRKVRKNMYHEQSFHWNWFWQLFTDTLRHRTLHITPFFHHLWCGEFWYGTII